MSVNKTKMSKTGDECLKILALPFQNLFISHEQCLIVVGGSTTMCRRPTSLHKI